MSELQNVLVGLNVFDRDIARAADLLGFPARDADLLRNLAPGDFFAMGPALSATPVLAHIDPTITEHLGKTPELRAAASVDADEAAKLLDLAGSPRSRTTAPPSPSRARARSTRSCSIPLRPTRPRSWTR